MARLCESEVRAKLSRQELCGEAIYHLLRLGKMDKETFTARMSALDRCGPDGAVGACYVAWMLLRNAPPRVPSVTLGCPKTRLSFAKCFVTWKRLPRKTLIAIRPREAHPH